jgi:ABC-type methionine transport system permease subunit
MWLELLFKSNVLCVHLNDVNFRLVHALASSYLNHLRAIPIIVYVVMLQSVQGAILPFRAGQAPHVRGDIAANV